MLKKTEYSELYNKNYCCMNSFINFTTNPSMFIVIRQQNDRDIPRI